MRDQNQPPPLSSTLIAGHQLRANFQVAAKMFKVETMFVGPIQPQMWLRFWDCSKVWGIFHWRFTSWMMTKFSRFPWGFGHWGLDRLPWDLEGLRGQRGKNGSNVYSTVKPQMVRAQHHIPPKMHCCILRLKPTNFMGPWYHFFWGQRQMASNYNIVEQNIHGRWTSDRWSLITGQIWLHLTAVHPSLDAMYIAFKPWIRQREFKALGPCWECSDQRAKKTAAKKQRQDEQTSWR